MAGPSIDQVTRAAVKFHEVRATANGLAWLESRPELDGRSVLVEWDARTRSTSTRSPEDLDVGTTAHAYGGGMYAVGEHGCYVVRATDSQIISIGSAGTKQITGSAGPGQAYGDLQLVSEDGLLCVRESSGPGASDALVSIVNGIETVLLRDNFLAGARLGPYGRLAWLRWSEDQMPWDATELFVADLGTDGLGTATLVAGGPEESVVEPSWSPDGVLHFISDRTGWWNLYRWDGGSVVPVAPMTAECAAAPWELGYSSYAFLPDGRVALLREKNAEVDLVILGSDGQVKTLPLPYTSHKPCLAPFGGRIGAIASSPADAPHVVLINPDPPYDVEVIARAPMPAGISLSMPRRAQVTVTPDVALNALIHTPQLPEGHQAPGLIVRPHAGPTDGIRQRLNWWTQYFTGLGFVVAELDYRGSTGYGRAFRQSLYGHWGEHDVEDVIALARHLIEAGQVDADRAFVSGESAGGFTALKAISRPDTPFAGAVASMAITDPGRWQESAPRFQRAHAAHLAVGAQPVSAAAVLRPVLLLHGSADSVAPANDVLSLAEQLDVLGKPCELLLLDGQGHGYSAPDRAAAALDAEHRFYDSLSKLAPAAQGAVSRPA